MRENLGYVVIVTYMPVSVKRSTYHEQEGFIAPSSFAQMNALEVANIPGGLSLTLKNGDIEIIPFGPHIKAIRVKKVLPDKPTNGTHCYSKD